MPALSTPQGPGPFRAHLQLLQLFLAHRDQVVEGIQGLLNAQRSPAQYLQDRELLARRFEDCFFTLAALTREQSGLRGRLQAAHRAGGFRPQDIPGLHNDLTDPVEMMIRGFSFWQQTRWPGRSGRAHYAQTLFNLYLIRCLQLLSMRVWDAGMEDASLGAAGPADVGLGGAGRRDAGVVDAGSRDAGGSASDRLALVQDALDRLWEINPVDQPRLVRDARWLIPLAQSPANTDLAPYFEVAARIAETLTEADRIEIHKAGIRMAGGHLRSQLRHYNQTRGESLADTSLILRTRRSNALDFAMMVQALAPLLQAYEQAVGGGDVPRRLALADAICQGMSADPELFVNRLDLLGAYCLIEYLHVAVDGAGRAVYTSTGLRHLELLQKYGALMARLSKPLHADCLRFGPIAGAYSPYGAIYGFSYNLLEHMTLKTLQPQAQTRFGLEDVFTAGDAAKLAWVSGWRKLPSIRPEVQRLYDYPQQFADEIFDRVERALRTRNSASAGEAGGEAEVVARTGRLYIVSGDDAGADPGADPGADAGTDAGADTGADHGTDSGRTLGAGSALQIPELPVEYIQSSDEQIVAASGALSRDQAELLHDRQEGMFVVSYQTPGGWVAVSKDILTDVLGAGRDARLQGLPGTAASVAGLTCPGLVLPAARTA